MKSWMQHLMFLSGIFIQIGTMNNVQTKNTHANLYTHQAFKQNDNIYRDRSTVYMYILFCTNYICIEEKRSEPENQTLIICEVSAHSCAFFCLQTKHWNRVMKSKLDGCIFTQHFLLKSRDSQGKVGINLIFFCLLSSLLSPGFIFFSTHLRSLCQHNMKAKCLPESEKV